MTGISTIELRRGYRISTIVKGNWQLAGNHGDVDSATAIADMFAFIDAGITTFDCADSDAGIELMIGAFLQDLKRARGAAAMRKVHVHTRFAPDRGVLAGLERNHVESVIDRSIARLGVDALDLVQFHCWDYEAAGCLDALGYLSLLQAKGKIRHVGVTNFDARHLEMLLRTGIDIAAAQVQFSLIDQRPAGVFAELCHQHNIAILAYGTLAGGFVSHRWLGAPDPGYDLKNSSLKKYRLIIDEFGGWSLLQDLLLVLSAIAARHGVTIANVAMRAMHDHGDVAAIILGSRYADHLAGNLKAFDFTATQRDREALAAVLARRRGPKGPVFGLERDESGPHGRLLRMGLSAPAA